MRPSKKSKTGKTLSKHYQKKVKNKAENPVGGKKVGKVENPVEGKKVGKVENPVEGKNVSKVENPVEGKKVGKVENPVEGKKVGKVGNPVEGKKFGKVDNHPLGKKVAKGENSAGGKTVGKNSELLSSQLKENKGQVKVTQHQPDSSTNVLDNSASESSDCSECDDNEDNKKYRKRKIVSNWKKYELPVPHDDEEEEEEPYDYKTSCLIPVPQSGRRKLENLVSLRPETTLNMDTDKIIAGLPSNPISTFAENSSPIAADNCFISEELTTCEHHGLIDASMSEMQTNGELEDELEALLALNQEKIQHMRIIEISNNPSRVGNVPPKPTCTNSQLPEIAELPKESLEDWLDSVLED